jgi:hypothetical protein
MDLRFATPVAADEATVFGVVADLTSYPRWLDLVHRVEPVPPAGDDGGPAYLVDLRARLGPLARSKRLRMVRVEHEPTGRVRFVRRELDGRQHAPWELRASVVPVNTSVAPDPGRGQLLPPGSSLVEVDLHYGGSLWAAPLELALRSHVERAIPRLQALVASGG